MLKDVNYEPICSRDIEDVVCPTDKIANQNVGGLWNTLNGWLESRLDWNRLEKLNDEKKISIEIKKVLHPAMLEAVGLPRGFKFSFSQDPRTLTANKYITDIKKIIYCGMAKELLPNNNTVCPRCDILKRCHPSLKVFEESVDKVIECSNKITNKNDAQKALAILDTLMTTYSDLSKITGQ